jgi:hypothetical protein
MEVCGEEGLMKKLKGARVKLVNGPRFFFFFLIFSSYGAWRGGAGPQGF